MEVDTGAITSIVTVDSDPGPVSANGKANDIAHEFHDNYDPTNFAYYLRIDIQQKLAQGQRNRIRCGSSRLSTRIEYTCSPPWG